MLTPRWVNTADLLSKEQVHKPKFATKVYLAADVEREVAQLKRTIEAFDATERELEQRLAAVEHNRDEWRANCNENANRVERMTQQVARLREVALKLLDAAIWMSAGDDFAVDGACRIGYETVVQPVLKEAQALLAEGP